MTAEEAVAQYYDAWRNGRGDMTTVPLAEDFRFVGPVASFESAEGFREMAHQAGQAVTSFEVRRQFVDGDTVCSIVDWEMAVPGVGRMTAAELLEVQDGVIVRGELIYDAEALRRAMSAQGA
jgi:ketosteroid isomerase-like protein